MFLYAIRLLQRQPQRLVLTIVAIALCAVMMLFLLATYSGVSDGSVDYIRKNSCDVWVLQQNSSNLLRGTSFLTEAFGDAIRDCEGVRASHPVLLLLPTVRCGVSRATIFLAGYDVAQRLGGPPGITDGRGVRDDGDIVLDRSFALKMSAAVGDSVFINETRFMVCGLSSGTNAFVIQYGFVTLAQARRVAGIPQLVSLYLVEADEGADALKLAGRIEKTVPGTAAFTNEVFLENNLHEMESGFLPLLFAIAGIGVVVMTVILSLLLGITILERRKDFAVMKTLGAPPGYLPGSIAVQAMMLTMLGMAAGVVIYPAMVFAVERLSPEINTITTLPHILLVAALCIIVGQASAMLSMRRLRSIYAMEVYQ